MPQRISDYITLCKVGIAIYIGITSWIGLFLNPFYAKFSIVQHILLILFSFLASSGSAVVNMIIERESDKLMTRTASRPLPTNRVSVMEAASLAIVLLGLAFGGAYYFLHFWYTLFLLLGSVIYIFVYTIWLKRRSGFWNVPIGGLSGTFAALAGGYALASDLNQDYSDVLLLGVALYFWSPAHFWNLGIYKLKEYQKAALPMLPGNSKKSGTVGVIFHVIGLFVTSLLFNAVGNRGYIFFWLMLFLNLCFLGLAIQNYRQVDDQKSKRLFLFSIFYLMAFYLILVVDQILSKYF